MLRWYWGGGGTGVEVVLVCSDHSNRRVWHLMRGLCLLLLCCLILRWRSWGWGWLVLLLQELLPIGVACECLLAVHLTLEITCMSAIRAELLLWVPPPSSSTARSGSTAAAGTAPASDATLSG